MKKVRYFMNCLRRGRPQLSLTKHRLGHRDEEKQGVGGVQKDGDDGIEGHDGGTVFSVPTRELVPAEDHGNAPGTADEG